MSIFAVMLEAIYTHSINLIKEKRYGKSYIKNFEKKLITFLIVISLVWSVCQNTVIAIEELVQDSISVVAEGQSERANSTLTIEPNLKPSDFKITTIRSDNK